MCVCVCMCAYTGRSSTSTQSLIVKNFRHPMVPLDDNYEWGNCVSKALSLIQDQGNGHHNYYDNTIVYDVE